MGKKDNQRHKAQSKKKAKLKTKREAKRREARVRELATEDISHANSWPIRDCIINRSWREHRLAQIVVARTRPDGQVAVGAFLVDLGCQGVKDAVLIHPMTPEDYQTGYLPHVTEGQDFVPCKLAMAAKVAETAVAYATDLGFRPHNDYRKACRIFGKVDTNIWPEEIECGQDGKPLYQPGPDEDVKSALDLLLRRAGPDGFNYTGPPLTPELQQALGVSQEAIVPEGSGLMTGKEADELAHLQDELAALSSEKALVQSFDEDEFDDEDDEDEPYGAAVPSGQAPSLLPIPKGPPRIFELRIEMTGIDPPVWRRVRVPSYVSLTVLHRILAAAMGWSGGALHSFESQGTLFGNVGRIGTRHGAGTLADEAMVRLDQIVSEAGHSLTYVYDFADQWKHTVVVDRIAPCGTEAPERAVFVTGERACPPEDCGGVDGYKDIIEAVASPAHDDYHATMEWLGEGWSPDRFDAKEAAERVAEVQLTSSADDEN